jgi:hypothetical protein
MAIKLKSKTIIDGGKSTGTLPEVLVIINSKKITYNGKMSKLEEK